jgi:two-component system phosphate regulon sensor histidine kinase PhoR
MKRENQTHMSKGMARNRQNPPKIGDHPWAGDDLAFYKFIIQSLPVAVITVDSELKITGFNQWAEGLTGYSAEEALGLFCGRVLQGGMCRIECPLKTVLTRQDPMVRIDTTIRNKSGEIIPVRMSTAALLDEEGRLIGGLEAFQDISKLKALEREKANLLSILAHDMKSPLIAIQGFVLRLLAQDSDTSEVKREQYLEIIRKEAGKLESLIDDFLEFSRLQTGKVNLNFSATSLEKELLEIYKVYQPRAAEAGIRLKFENPESLEIIKADAARLRRVFANLLDNALKFNTGKGTVTISARQTELDIRVSITDEGVGIHDKDLLYIFDSFQRGKDVVGKEGFGLGLAGVKTIVEAHGGRVLVKSKVGKGSVFTVILPKTGIDSHLDQISSRTTS